MLNGLFATLLAVGIGGVLSFAGTASAEPDFKISTGYSQNADPIAAAKEATAMALDKLGAQPKGLVFFEIYKGHEKEMQIGQAVADAAKGVPSVGVRAIPHTDKGTMWENAISVLAIGGKDANVMVLSQPLVDDRQQMGQSVGATLRSVNNLKLVLVLAEPNLSFAPEKVSVEAFLHGLHGMLGDGVSVFGGNGMPDVGSSIEFINGTANKNTISIIAIGGPVRLIGNNGNEFKPTETIATVTKARGKWVMELDGRPASEVYRQAAGLAADFPLRGTQTNPIGVELGEGQTYVREILCEKKENLSLYSDKEKNKDFASYMQESSDLPVGSLRFVASVPEGTKVNILSYAKSSQRIIDSATATMKRSISQIQSGETPLLALTSSCCARRSRLRTMDPKADEVLQGIHPAMGANIFPVFGLDAYGELGPINKPYEGLPYQYQQHTFVSGVLVLETK